MIHHQNENTNHQLPSSRQLLSKWTVNLFSMERWAIVFSILINALLIISSLRAMEHNKKNPFLFQQATHKTEKDHANVAFHGLKQNQSYTTPHYFAYTGDSMIPPTDDIGRPLFSSALGNSCVTRGLCIGDILSHLGKIETRSKKLLVIGNDILTQEILSILSKHQVFKMSVPTSDDKDPIANSLRNQLLQTSSKGTLDQLDLAVIGTDFQNEKHNFCKVLMDVLMTTQPKVFVTVFNPIFPPPIIFMNIEDEENTLPNLSPFCGCSLSAIVKIADKFGFQLLQVEAWKATFIKRSFHFLYGDAETDVRRMWYSGFIHALANCIEASDFSDNRLSMAEKHWIQLRADSRLFWRHPFNSELTNSAVAWLRKTQVQFEISHFNFDLFLDVSTIGARRNTRKKLGKKLFCYAIQSVGALDPRFDELWNGVHYEGTTTADVIQLSWKDEVANAEYLPNSMWGQGRNKLLELIEKQEKEVNQGEYLYWILMDGDGAFDFPLNQADFSTYKGWYSFERRLMEHLPAFASPQNYFGKAQWPDPTPKRLLESFHTRYNIDANINAYHRDAISRLLPYQLDWDAQCWWHSQLVQLQKLQVLYPHEKGYLQGVGMKNTQSGPYPRKMNFTFTTDDWKMKHLPEFHHHCVSGVVSNFVPMTYPSIQPSAINDIPNFGGRTFWNTKSCTQN